jgi:putative transposase
MDSRGRAMDNIFVERLWRSLKYEDIYIHNYETPPELYKGLTRYFGLYNNERLHESLDYKTPWEVHFGISNMPMLNEIGCYNANKELILPTNTVK